MRAASTIGISIGGATIGLGVAGRMFPEPSTPLMIGNLVAGSVSFAVSTRAWMLGQRPEHTPTDAATEARGSTRGPIETRLAPTFSLLAHKSAGIALNVRF